MMTFLLILLATSILSALGVLTISISRTSSARLVFGFLLLLALLPLGTFLPGIDYSLPYAHSESQNTIPWINVILCIWLAGVTFGVGKLIQDVIAYRIWSNTGHTVEDKYTLELLSHVCEQAGLSDTPNLSTSPQVSSPVLGGILNPTLFLPANYREWSQDTVEMVFWHEVGHMAQRDLVKQLIGRIIKTFYWFNPFITSLQKTLSRHCELSCDTWVMHRGVSRKTYLNALCDVAECVGTTRRPAVALSMADHATLSERVKALLDKPSQKRPILVISILSVLSILSLALVSLKPSQNNVSQQEIELRLSANPFPQD